MLFVGTKKQAQDVMREEAPPRRPVLRHQPLARRHADQLQDASSRVIDRLHALEKMARTAPSSADQEGSRSAHARAREAREALGGIKEHDRAARRVFVIDPNKEHIAVHEARKLGDPDRRRSSTPTATRTSSTTSSPATTTPSARIKLFTAQDRRRLHRGPEGPARARQPAARAPAPKKAAQEQQTIRVSSGGDGPRVEIVSRRRSDLPTPEAAATPEDEAGRG